MAFDDPLIDTLSISGAELRHADALMLMSDGTAGGSRSGVRPGDGSLAVTLTGAGSTTINVAAGVAACSYPAQGIYRAYNQTAWTGTLAAAHATLDRIDLVYLRVWDNSVDAGGLAKADAVYLAGTAGAGVAPTPSGTLIYIPLATIAVPHSGGGTPARTDARPVTVAPGGIAIGSTVTGVYAGQYRDNGGALERWSGSAWLATGGIAPSSLGSGAYTGQYRDSVTGRPDRWNGSAWINGALIVRKTADQSVTNSMTYVNATDLVVPLEPSASYAFEAFIVYSTTAAADIKFQWTIPSGATLLWSPWSINDASATTDTGPIRTVVGNSGFATLSSMGSTTNVSARPIGTINTGSTAGNLQFQFAQNTADTVASNIRAGSWLKLERIS